MGERPSQPAPGDREPGEDPHRRGHRGGRIVRGALRAAQIRPQECERECPEDVHGGQPGGRHPDGPQPGLRPERLGEDEVLAEKAAERRDPGERKRPDGKCGRGARQPPRQPAHPPHIGLPAERVHHGARGEEQERFEKGVRCQMEDPGGERPHPDREEHVPELADRRVGEHPLEVGFDEGGGGGEDRRDRPHGRDEIHGGRRAEKHGVQPDDHVDSGRHHRRRMDQGAHRRWPFHRVGEPDVQRELRGFSGGAREQEKRERGRGAAAEREPRAGVPGHHPKVRRPEHAKRHKDAEEEADVPQPRDEKRLDPGRGRRGAGEPEGDEEVAAQPHAFPPNEHGREIAGEHEPEHRGHE